MPRLPATSPGVSANRRTIYGRLLLISCFFLFCFFVSFPSSTRYARPNRRTGPREGEIQIDCRRNGYYFRRIGWLLKHHSTTNTTHINCNNNCKNNCKNSNKKTPSAKRFLINYSLSSSSFLLLPHPPVRHSDIYRHHHHTSTPGRNPQQPHIQTPCFDSSLLFSLLNINDSIGPIWFFCSFFPSPSFLSALQWFLILYSSTSPHLLSYYYYPPPPPPPSTHKQLTGFLCFTLKEEKNKQQTTMQFSWIVFRVYIPLHVLYFYLPHLDLPIYLSIYLLIYPSIYLYVYLSIYLPPCPAMITRSFFHLFISSLFLTCQVIERSKARELQKQNIKQQILQQQEEYKQHQQLSYQNVEPFTPTSTPTRRY